MLTYRANGPIFIFIERGNEARHKMEMEMAAIYTTSGDIITDGLQGCNLCDEAINTAISIAKERGTDVELVDDDGRWLVHPVGAADFLGDCLDPSAD